MGFSVKIKAFFKDKGLTNRAVAKIMDEYSEGMVSKYHNSDDWHDNYIKKLIKYFPEIDLNELLKDDTELKKVNDTTEYLKDENLAIIQELEEKLKTLKINLK